MYLITKWFGTFLCDKKRIVKKILFAKNEKIIYRKMLKIQQREVLAEEKKITKSAKDIFVNESRLKKLGEYKPSDPVFKKIKINANMFDFSDKLLHKATLLVTQNRVDKKLASEDLQIIQMVNTLDELIHTSNLLYERLESWSIIPTPKKKIQPLKNTYSTINNEIKSLELQIENDMEKIAPNITNIVGPLIGARLISHSAGIEKLATMPASTIQILGAEKALFRYKKEGGKPPKHGVIFQHTYINKAKRELRGKIARIFALKIAIAAKADVFTKRNISKELKEDMNKRIKDIKNL